MTNQDLRLIKSQYCLKLCLDNIVNKGKGNIKGKPY